MAEMMVSSYIPSNTVTSPAAQVYGAVYNPNQYQTGDFDNFNIEWQPDTSNSGKLWVTPNQDMSNLQQEVANLRSVIDNLQIQLTSVILKADERETELNKKVDKLEMLLKAILSSARGECLILPAD